MSIRKVSFIVLVALISSFSSIGLYKVLEGDKIEANTIQQPDFRAELANWAANLPAGTADLDFTVAAALTTPGVVHVKSSGATPSNNDPFDFWGDPFTPKGGTSTGSGVIISQDGYIVTNNHVIENARDIEITLSNNKRYDAELIGTDPSSDIALLKIKETNLAYLQFGNSDNVKVGEWVLAVGNPFDLESTVTAGIVSAKSRSINILSSKSNTPIESFIQTDAAVNPGNSGGALVNTRGELIGVNTAIIAPNGTFAGYSFAVPGNLVKKVVKDLKDFGTVKRGFLGVSIQDVEGDLAEQEGLVGVEGVYVQQVNPGSAALAAGLKAGDVITHINGVAVKSSPELQEQVARFRPDDVITVNYLRNGVAKTTRAKLLSGEVATNPSTLRESRSSNEPSHRSGGNILEDLGAEFQGLSRREKNELNIDSGLKIKELYSSGKISQYTGIKEGFIMTEVNNVEVNSMDDLREALNAKKGIVAIEGFYPDAPSRQFYYTFSY